jgi:hypothetical protein
VATGNIMEDVRALPQSMAQFSHQGAGLFESSLVFKPLNHSKASDVRDRSLKFPSFSLRSRASSTP